MNRTVYDKCARHSHRTIITMEDIIDHKTDLFVRNVKDTTHRAIINMEDIMDHKYNCE